ncbi:hypothetical protein FS749_009269 [Ceratobasidium sp. UAMH 11750]|nr:hypothetical protein FS749_009269 [Ceratobasidium sp. UAMH 11750]
MKKKLEEYHMNGDRPVEKEDHTFLDDLIQRTKDEKLIKDQILNILLAGRDSTAGTLTFTVYLLAMDPAVIAKLRMEIINRVGPSEYPTPEHFKEMKYLRAVIDETFTTISTASYQRTYLYSTYCTQIEWWKEFLHSSRSKRELLGDAYATTQGSLGDYFDPERWFDERQKKYVGSNPSIFLPFNAGPRNCLGQQFAYNIMSFFLVRLLQRFEAIELVPEAQPIGTLPPANWKGAAGRKGFERIWPKYHLMTSCNGGLWVRMTPAKVVEE